MQNIKKMIAEKIARVLNKDVDEIEANIEEPKDKSKGDYAYPCFKLSKELRKSPVDIAQDIKERVSISDIESLDRLEVVAGYLNFFVNDIDVVKNIMTEITNKKETFLNSQEGNNKNVCIDYSSPNIAKPFHIGHLRSTVIGNALYNIYKVLGYNVIGINHLGDFGTQFGLVIEGYKRWGNEYDLEQNPIKCLVDIYVRINELGKTDETVKDLARDNFKKLEEDDPKTVEMWSRFRELSLKEYERIYKMLDVTFDSYNGEAFYNDKMEEIVSILKDKNIMLESQGATVVPIDGYDIPCMILKSNGSTTYTTRDLAAALYRKREYDYYKSIYVTSYEQSLHFAQMFKVAEYIVGKDYAKNMVHVPFGMVLGKGGKKISTRGGAKATLEDILNEAIDKAREILMEKGKADKENIDELARQIGVGAIVFNDLKNNRIKDEIFSLEDMLKFDGETGPYVQYMYVRTNSILEKAGFDIDSVDIKNVDFSLLKEKEEVELVKKIYKVKDVIKSAASEYEPSIITRYVIEVASMFSTYYNAQHIIVEDNKVKEARLCLVYVTGLIIKESLRILGIKCPDKM